MSTEDCKLCEKPSTPWFHINGHICQDCYSAALAWIKIKDRLPEKDGRYLVYEPQYDWVCVASLKEGKFDNDMATHWLSLPPTPKPVIIPDF